MSYPWTVGASWRMQSRVSISYRLMKPQHVPHRPPLLCCLVAPMTVLDEVLFIARRNFLILEVSGHVSTMSLHSVFSVWVGSVGLLGKRETDLLLKQNNESEQISRIIVGSGKNNILFNFIFLQDCLRDDALVPPTPPGYVKDKKEQRVQNCSEKSGVFMDPPLPFPIIQERTFFSPTSPTRKQTG